MPIAKPRAQTPDHEWRCAAHQAGTGTRTLPGSHYCARCRSWTTWCLYPAAGGAR